MAPRLAKKRPNPDYLLIKKLSRQGFKKIIGVDEVGRGSIAGPLIVAAVEITYFIKGVRDSKLIPKTRHSDLANLIRQASQQISIGCVSNSEIDRLGMKESLVLAYQRALKNIEYNLILTDAIKLPLTCPQFKSIKGDNLFYSCAAASIIAKTVRDKLMISYSRIFPAYLWHKNAGYATSHHLEAIKKFGPTPLHRLTFIH